MCMMSSYWLNEFQTMYSTEIIFSKDIIQHPPFCPVHHLTDEMKASLPPDIYSRGIDCGAAVILESGDGKIFLTRRGDHLRTFPGIWVPPGKLHH